MKEMQQKSSRILSWFEEIWFSDTIMKYFIVFPAGMWCMMILSVILSIMEPSNIHYPIAFLMFTLLALATVLLGARREWRKNVNNNKK
jgi:hypothetical protein